MLAELQKCKGQKTSKFIQVIKKLGYTYSRTSGSHEIWEKPNKPPLSIPNHPELAPGTWRNLVKLIE